jgi:predicted ribosome quality control (RQC) complex YloA/Tae2 family protein
MKLEIFEFQNETYEIQIGKNKLENDELVRHSSPNDIWFHIANAPSCHVVLIAHNEKSLPKQVIKRCACLCKSNSSSSSIKNCEIIYTTISNIECTDILGQVIAKNTKKIII